MKVLLTLLIEKLSDGGEEDAEVRFPVFLSFHIVANLLMSIRSRDIYELNHWFKFAVLLFFS